MDEDKVLSKEDYFMAVALISSGRSKDPQRMVLDLGALLQVKAGPQ